jgi:hypothetical protein
VGDLTRLIREEPALRRPSALARTVGTVMLEASARALARVDYLLGKEAHVWKVVESAKAPTGGTNGLVPGRVERVAAVGLAAPDARERDG